MYRVVLVDDEELELTGIQKLVPWKELHMEVKAACPDGFSALNYLEENEADILVSDIRMPIMSGLELASKAQRLHPNLKILFISGYEDFQYAKQALSMKASGYVLKPINDDELFGALQSVRSDLDGANRQQQREQSIQQSMVYLKNELLERCLEGTPDRDAVIELMAQFRLGVQVGRLRAAIIEIEDRDWRTESQYSEEAHAELLGALTSLCSRYGMEMFCRLSPRRLAVVLEESHTEATLERMMEELSAGHHATLTIGLGQAVDELERLHLSYEEASKALAMKMFQGKGKIIAYSATKEEAQASALNIEATVDAILAAMTQYELVRIVDCMEELFQQVKNIKNPSAVHNYSLFVISRLDAYLNSLNESLLSMTGQNGFALDKLFDFETIDDIHSWLRRKIFELSEQLHNKRQRRNVKLIGQIQSFIDQRLGESISLKEAAQAFSFSPNYLGHLFKEETGELFSDYLMRKRMELAKGLLADTGLKVYEVADRVGSGTLAHFGKQFKDYTGMTPGEYRKHL